MRLRVLLVCLLAPMLVVGCGKIRSINKENLDPPTELTDISPSVGVTKLWSRSLGKGERRMGLRQRVAVSGGVVYAADPAGTVRAFAADSGAPRWSIELDQRLGGSPAVADGLLVIGGLDGQVFALDPETGVERWRAEVSSEVVSAAAISRGIVVVRVNDGRLFGFDAADGRRRWVFDRGLPPLTLRGNGSPLAQDGVVFVGYETGSLIALRLEDGVQLWESPVAVAEGRTDLERMVDVDGDLAFADGELFAASYRNQTMAFIAGNGRPLWNRELGSYGGVALLGDRVFASDRDGTVWSLDRRSGSAVWRQEGLAHRWLSTPAVQGRYVVVGDLEGWLHWLDSETGAFAARVRLGKEPIRARPVVEGEYLFAVDVEGSLHAYRLGTP